MLFEEITAFACARFGVMPKHLSRHGHFEPVLSRKGNPSPQPNPPNAIRFLQRFQLLALIKAI